MTEEIFLLQGETLTALPARSFRDGLNGEFLERALHVLLERYPSLLPGSQIDPSTEDPPRFALLASEVPIGSWSLDILMVDQFGVPTLVETKLSENPEARRKVVGQIIEYAASAADALANGRGRACAESFWSGKGGALDLAETFGGRFDDDAMWRSFEKNLEERRVRLVIAADFIRPEVRRMIEYLNTEMENVEVLGLELRAFAGAEDEAVVVVPRVIGQTLQVAEKKTADQPVAWTLDRLRDVFGNSQDAGIRNNFLSVIDWGANNGRVVTGRRTRPGFYVAGHSGQPIANIRESEIYVHMIPDRYRGGLEQLNTVVQRMKALGMFDDALDPSTVIDGRTAKVKLQELPTEGVRQLIELWENC